MNYAVEISNLTKAFKGRTVVNHLNLHVKKGEIYGFVGMNGAGKSTVMKMLMSLVQPDSGTISVFGEMIRDGSFDYLKRIGSIIENPYFYEKLTARQNLELHCDYMQYPDYNRIDEVLELVRLQDIHGKTVSHFSLGMKQRLAIARAILTNPELLILDEPINALDPEGIRDMRSLFQSLNQNCGTTVFISSHILSEVEHIADTIGIISDGILLKEVSVQDIHEFQTEYMELCVDDVYRAARILEQNGICSDFSVVSDSLIRIYDKNVSGITISALLVKNGVGLETVGRKQNSLEDYFFQISDSDKSNKSDKEEL